MWCNKGNPSIYYFGQWNNHTMMKMALFDSEFQKKKFKAGNIKEMDALIAFREFVDRNGTMTLFSIFCYLDFIS